MDLATFLDTRRPEWRQLEQMLRRVEGSGLRGLSDAEAIEFGRLYRRAASDLNQAQTYVSGDEVASYLNQLVARGYAVIYGGRARVPFWSAVKAAFFGYPVVVRRHLGALLLAANLFVLGAGLAFVLTLSDPTFLEHVIPAGFPHITPAEDGSGGDHSMTVGELTAFGGFLFANNLRTTLVAFALGLTCGLGTGWLLFYNGLMMGTIGALFLRAGQMTQFAAGILPHGVLEIPAVFLGGAAGLIMARALIVARPWSRLDELARAGKEALKLVAGAAPLLLAAAFLEAGVARAPGWLLGDWLKLAVAGGVGFAFVAYLAFVGREQPAA